MAKTKKSTKRAYIFGLVLLLLVGVASWSIYALINQLASDLLTYINIENVYIKYLIPIIVVIIILIISGKKVTEAIDKVLR